MIICDTNVLSTFARANESGLLFKLFPKHELAIPQAVYEEISEAMRRGFTFLESALQFVDSGQIHLLTLTAEEKIECTALPKSLGRGESEAIAICLRQRAILFSNDKRARNYCHAHGIEVYDLVRLLRALWKEKIVSRQRIQKIVTKIEKLENIVIKNKNEIFKK